MRDSFGRTIDYLRIALTNGCNLRCTYCMPSGPAPVERAGELLSPAELETVARAAVGLGFRKFRLTGGEPTLRPDLLDIVSRISKVPGAREVVLTTNGLRLAELAWPLARAGLRRVNVHLDALGENSLARSMRGASLSRILAGIEAAEAAGLVPVKLNAVVQRGVNEDDAIDLAALTKERDWHVRFVELMPLGDGECARIARARFVPSAETRARLEAALGPLGELPRADPSDEALQLRFAGARGVVGFISPVTEPFCGACNRMRLTADGRFRLCLLHDDELDVRAALRAGEGEAGVASILARAVAAKPRGHELASDRAPRARLMHEIGG